METNHNESKPMGIFETIKGIIIHPVKTFETLGQSPKVGFPALMVGIGSTLFSLISSIYSKEIMQKAIEESTKGLPPESIEMTKTIAAITSSPVFAVIGGVIGAYIGWFVMSAIYWGLVSIFGGKGTYKQSLTVWGYAWIAVLIGYIIKIVYMFITGKPVTSASTATVMDVILSGNDIFKLWQLFLLVVGYSAAYRISKVKSAIIILGLWLFGILYSAGSFILSQNILKNMPQP